jgi:pimeloyl-ACP methyl ester carboxylesterase
MLRRILRWISWTLVAVGSAFALILLFFSWQGSLRESRNAIDAAPPTGRFVHAYDTQIFIQEAGPASGRPVLLIHGTGAWSEIWRDTISPLSDAGFRTIAMDLPPFGYSGKPEGASAYSRENQARRIIGVLDALQLQHVILIGHSVGARPTVEAALEAPGQVERLVLVDPALGFQSNPADTPHFAQNDAPWIVRTIFGTRPLRDAILATYGANPLSTRPLFRSFVSRKDAVTDARVKMLQAPLAVRNTIKGYGDWMQYLLVSQDSSLASDFANFRKLTMPVSLIWGSLDRVTPLWQGEALQKLMPNSGLAVIDGVGHIPFVEAVPEFNGVLLKILAQ